MNGAIAKAQQIKDSDPDKYVLLGQFDNPANPKIHEETTGPEIWRDTGGDIDIFIAGVGTGGTITGTSRYIKLTQGKKMMTVAVEPTDSPVISQTLAGEPIKPGPHKIQGIGAGFIPGNLDLDMIDAVELVTNDEAMAMAHRLMKEEGILAGISSGAAVVAAKRLAELPENAGKNIVVILASSAERYLSSPLFSDTFSDKELVQ
jgi:cysteine synthase A